MLVELSRRGNSTQNKHHDDNYRLALGVSARCHDDGLLDWVDVIRKPMAGYDENALTYDVDTTIYCDIATAHPLR